MFIKIHSGFKVLLAFLDKEKVDRSTYIQLGEYVQWKRLKELIVLYNRNHPEDQQISAEDLVKQESIVYSAEFEQIKEVGSPFGVWDSNEGFGVQKERKESHGNG